MKLSLFSILLIILLMMNNNNNICKSNQINNNKIFEAAKPIDFKIYKALYYIDRNDEITINMTLNNIKNIYYDSRLQDRLNVILIAFSNGYQVYSNPIYIPMLKTIQNLGCHLVLCGNTKKQFNINLQDLFPGVYVVPSGNGEIILRLSDGWVGIHP